MSGAGAPRDVALEIRVHLLPAPGEFVRRGPRPGLQQHRVGIEGARRGSAATPGGPVSRAFRVRASQRQDCRAATGPDIARLHLIERGRCVPFAREARRRVGWKCDLTAANRGRRLRIPDTQRCLWLAGFEERRSGGGRKTSAPHTGWGLKRRDAEGSLEQLPQLYRPAIGQECDRLEVIPRHPCPAFDLVRIRPRGCRERVIICRAAGGEGVDLGTAHWVGAETARRRGKPKQLPFSYRGPFGRQWARIAALSGKLRGRPVLAGNGAVRPQTERRVSERRGACCRGSGTSAVPRTPERFGSFATITKRDTLVPIALRRPNPLPPQAEQTPTPQSARRLRRRVQTVATAPHRPASASLHTSRALWRAPCFGSFRKDLISSRFRPS